jgi:hypothetical protein
MAAGSAPLSPSSMRSLTQGVRTPDWGQGEYRIYGQGQECLLSTRVSVQHDMESKCWMHAQRNRMCLSICQDTSTVLWRYHPTSSNNYWL